ncbi:hypothetical protein K7X08_018701 [Anisodus acutangulus]|uniref:Uncharacterized protein n=1 Tax=Anisodus acutangulus TaxID=402998 RepID=A0A9Q1R960_9SOLA|nr:hypothetical protein K7X08_018701 [Anisodus acutangulus]
MDRMHDGDKVGDKPNLAPEEMHYDNCGQLKHCFQVSVGSADEAGMDDRDVDAIMPKLQRADYYIVPPI